MVHATRLALWVIDNPMQDMEGNGIPAEVSLCGLRGPHVGMPRFACTAAELVIRGETVEQEHWPTCPVCKKQLDEATARLRTLP